MADVFNLISVFKLLDVDDIADVSHQKNLHFDFEEEF